MKKILLLILFSYGLNLKAQIAIYDAMKLKNLGVRRMPDSQKLCLPEADAVLKILRNYVPNIDSTDQKIENDFDQNPFIVICDGGSLGGSKNKSNNIFSSIGGLDVTNFADGLAKFLVKRFKEELSIAFFEKFKKDLSDTSHQALQILFSQTYKVLQTVDKDIYNVSAYINTLREAFIKDLTNMYTSFKKVKDLPKYKTLWESNPELKTLVLNAFYFIDALTNRVHPGDIIANYDINALNFSSDDLQTNVRSSVQLLKIFSNSCRSTSADHYWVTADSVRRFLSDPISRDIYFGLIYQLSDTIRFKNGTNNSTFRDILKRAHGPLNEMDQFQNYIETIIDHAQEVNEYMADIKSKEKSEIDYNDYYKLFDASLDILDDGLSIVNLSILHIEDDMRNNINTRAARLLNIARNSGELYVDIRTKNYSSAVLNTISLIDSIFDSRFDNKLRFCILKYGNLAANVAMAKNSDEVEKAIEAVALPAGSARVKRESAVNISLNAYVGGFSGYEYMPVLKNDKTAGTIAFTAPVGIAFSLGNVGKNNSKATGGKSLTLFMPVIDVGSLASFRLKDDSSKVSSEIQLKNIFAPGLFLYFGFGRCPVSIGAGAQVGPQLREVTAKDINIEKNYYIRYGISICVDIPLLNFYTKSK